MGVGDVMLLRVSARFDGEPVMNSLAFVDVGSGLDQGAATQAGLADAFNGALGMTNPAGDWLTGLSVQYQLQSLEVVDVVPGTFPLYSLALGGVGTVADDDAMPPNDALCITWRSQFKGQGGRGRTYLTGFAEGAANGGYWEAGTQDYATTIANDIINAFGESASSPYRFCILHRQHLGAAIVPPEQKPVMSYTVHNEVRSLGRRAVGRRIHRTRA